MDSFPEMKYTFNNIQITLIDHVVWAAKGEERLRS